MRPPPGHQATTNGITGTRPNAETKRPAHRGSTKKVVASRVIRAMKAAGMQPQGWQVRSLTTTLLAAHEEPTEEQVMRTLMAAPWCPKPRIRRHGIGGPGWRVTT